MALCLGWAHFSCFERNKPAPLSSFQAYSFGCPIGLVYKDAFGSILVYPQEKVAAPPKGMGLKSSPFGKAGDVGGSWYYPWAKIQEGVTHPS